AAIPASTSSHPTVSRKSRLAAACPGTRGMAGNLSGAAQPLSVALGQGDVDRRAEDDRASDDADLLVGALHRAGKDVASRLGGVRRRELDVELHGDVLEPVVSLVVAEL